MLVYSLNTFYKYLSIAFKTNKFFYVEQFGNMEQGAYTKMFSIISPWVREGTPVGAQATIGTLPPPNMGSSGGGKGLQT